MAFGQSNPFSFSVNTGTTPAAGAANSAPAFGFGGTPFGATSTPAFGATSTPAFGATSTPAFGATSTPAYGATSTPSLFGAASTPAFGAPQGTPGAFGGALVPANPTPQFQLGQSAPAGGLFGAPAGTPGAPFGQTMGPGAQVAASLTTKDSKPLTHATEWDMLTDQAQQQLLLLEKEVRGARADSENLESCQRLKDMKSHKQALESEATALLHQLEGLKCRVEGDTGSVHSLRELVMELLHFTDAAVRTFKRDQQWRELAKAGGGQAVPLSVLEALSAPVVLPSAFLQHTASGLQGTVSQFQRAAQDLQQALGAQSFHDSAAGMTPAERLESAVHNMHAYFVSTAAKVEALHQRVEDAKTAYLAKRKQEGNYSNPFEEADRWADFKASQQSGAAALGPASTSQAAPGAGAPAGAPAAAQPAGAAPAPASTLFGATAPATGAFGTPAAGPFGGPAALPAPAGASTLNRSGSRSRAKSGRK